MTESARIADNSPLLIISLLIIDSLHFVFARMLLPYIAPATSAMYVMAIGTIEVGLFCLFRRRLHFHVLKQNIWFFLGIGFLVAASTNINYEVVAFIDPGTATMLGRTSLLFGIGFGLLWIKETLSPLQAVGAFVAVCGVFTITFQPGDYLRFGSLLVLLSAFMYALHAAITKRYGEQMAFFDFFFFRLLCTFGILFLFVIGRQTLVFPDTTTWLLLILVGTVDVVISRSLYYLALRRLTVSIHAIVIALSPVAAILWSLLLFNTLPNQQQFMGGIAVITGVMIVLLNRNR